jgi:hypothetical protein
MLKLILKFIFVFSILTICHVSKINSLNTEPDLNYIIKMVEMQQSKLVNNIQDSVFIAKAVYSEKGNDGKLKKEVITQRRIYTKKSKVREEYLSMVVNGRELDGKEKEKAINDWKKNSKRSETKMPFSLEGKNAYDYNLIGSETRGDIPVWVLSFIARQKGDGYINGKVYISKNEYNIIYTEFTPANIPSVIKDIKLSLAYSDIQGYWLPVKFEMDMKIQVKFMVNMFYKQIRIEDTYTQYKLNSQLSDSIFKG